jgi:hypothetical protein
LGAHGLFIASPARIESFCILVARERPRFVTARRAGFPFLCRVCFDESAPPSGVTPQLKTSLEGTACAATATLASGQPSGTSVQVPSGDNSPSAQPSGDAGGEMVYSRIFWKTRFHFFA